MNKIEIGSFVRHPLLNKVLVVKKISGDERVAICSDFITKEQQTYVFERLEPLLKSEVCSFLNELEEVAKATIQRVEQLRDICGLD